MKISIDSKIISQIVNVETWYEDNFGYCICVFCLNTYPAHEDDCPWVELGKIFKGVEEKFEEAPEKPNA